MAPLTHSDPGPFPIVHSDDTTGHNLTEPLSPFTVSTSRGFLPLADPPTSLPAAFAPVERLLRAMPMRRANGLPGLLAEGRFGEAIDGGLPDLSREVADAAAGDPALATALYRDYSFLASAYLLEPCEPSLAPRTNLVSLMTT
jgi:indoleamine 2,3-dioxygenase